MKVQFLHPLTMRFQDKSLNAEEIHVAIHQQAMKRRRNSEWNNGGILVALGVFTLWWCIAYLALNGLVNKGDIIGVALLAVYTFVGWWALKAYYRPQLTVR